VAKNNGSSAKERNNLGTFYIRDLRPKAASDHEDGTKLLAHADPKTIIKYYLRKPKKVTPSR